MRRLIAVGICAGILAVLMTASACAQESKEPAPGMAAPAAPAEAAPAAPAAPAEAAPAEATPQAAPPAPQAAEQAKDISIYGEVQTVNPAANSVTVQYYDYDADEEKTIELTADSATKFENAALLNDIKKGDWLDGTYAVSAGKNIAKSIVVEREEALPPAQESDQTPPPGVTDDEY